MILSLASGPIGVLSTSGPASEPTPLFSSRGAVTNAEAKASGTALPRTMTTVKTIASKAGVNLEGVEINILVGEDDIRYLDFMGACATTCPGQIGLGPASFTGETMLAATLAHESVHIQQNIEGRVNTADQQALGDEAPSPPSPAQWPRWRRLTPQTPLPQRLTWEWEGDVTSAAKVDGSPAIPEAAARTNR